MDGFMLTAAGGTLFTLLYVVVIVGFFYFFLIRPQRKEQKEKQSMLSALAVGDSVLTTAGFYGVVIDMTEDTVIVEFGNNKNCRIPMQKAAIVQIEKPEPAPEPEPVPQPSSMPELYYTYNGHTYGFYDAERYKLNSYDDVAGFCRSQDGYLAVINDQGENNFLFDIVQSNYHDTAFFGYTDEADEGSWEWEKGNSNFDNWTVYGQNQPDNGSGYGGDEDYAEFNYERDTMSPNDGTWNDAPFRDNTNTFICEWDYDWTKG